MLDCQIGRVTVKTANSFGILPLAIVQSESDGCQLELGLTSFRPGGYAARWF